MNIGMKRGKQKVHLRTQPFNYSQTFCWFTFIPHFHTPFSYPIFIPTFDPMKIGYGNVFCFTKGVLSCIYVVMNKRTLLYYIYTYICLYPHMYIYMYICLYVHTRVSVRVCVHMMYNLCIYIYIYIQIYIYIH